MINNGSTEITSGNCTDWRCQLFQAVIVRLVINKIKGNAGPRQLFFQRVLCFDLFTAYNVKKMVMSRWMIVKNVHHIFCTRISTFVYSSPIDWGQPSNIRCTTFPTIGRRQFCWSCPYLASWYLLPHCCTDSTSKLSAGAVLAHTLTRPFS